MNSKDTLHLSTLTDELSARLPALQPAPPIFEGTFHEFFTSYVSPNLPSIERVREFNAALGEYFAIRAPQYLIRKVGSLNRRETHTTAGGQLLLPCDNSPGWWLHMFLLGDIPFPTDMVTFFQQIPRHIFDIKLKNQLNKAGFHLAHLSDVGNRDTSWHSWNKEELQRRMVLNLHPWNWSLIAKKNWQHYGGRKDIIVAIHHEYTELYGQPYIEWRQGHALDLALGKSMIAYSYGNEPSQKTQRIEPVSPTSIFSSRRPVIKREWIGTGIVLSLHLASGKCEFPHDELLTWVSQNTKALSTISWNRDGIYHWPNPSKKMRGFLDRYLSK